MNLEVIKSMLKSLKSGDSFHIEGEQDVLEKLCEEAGTQIENVDGKIFRISMPKGSEKSKMRQIKEILDSYLRGDVEVDFSTGYVRQVVSKYNTRNGDNFKVKSSKNDKPVIYKDIEDRDYITQLEYDELSRELDAKLLELRQKVRPTAFFTFYEQHPEADGPKDQWKHTVETFNNSVENIDIIIDGEVETEDGPIKPSSFDDEIIL